VDYSFRLTEILEALLSFWNCINAPLHVSEKPAIRRDQKEQEIFQNPIELVVWHDPNADARQELIRWRI
jgi:hypothetical protein